MKNWKIIKLNLMYGFNNKKKLEKLNEKHSFDIDIAPNKIRKQLETHIPLRKKSFLQNQLKNYKKKF